MVITKTFQNFAKEKSNLKGMPERTHFLLGCFVVDQIRVNYKWTRENVLALMETRFGKFAIIIEPQTGDGHFELLRTHFAIYILVVSFRCPFHSTHRLACEHTHWVLYWHLPWISLHICSTPICVDSVLKPLCGFVICCYFCFSSERALIFTFETKKWPALK